jgi:hypothetical protein
VGVSKWRFTSPLSLPFCAFLFFEIKENNFGNQHGVCVWGWGSGRIRGNKKEWRKLASELQYATVLWVGEFWMWASCFTGEKQIFVSSPFSADEYAIACEVVADMTCFYS